MPQYRCSTCYCRPDPVCFAALMAQVSCAWHAKTGFMCKTGFMSIACKDLHCVTRDVTVGMTCQAQRSAWNCPSIYQILTVSGMQNAVTGCSSLAHATPSYLKDIQDDNAAGSLQRRTDSKAGPCMLSSTMLVQTTCLSSTPIRGLVCSVRYTSSLH